MALSKTERRALLVLREKLSDSHLKECGFYLPEDYKAKGYLKSDAPAITEATKTYRDSWVLPIIDALLDDSGAKAKAMGWANRAAALNDMGRF